MKWNMDKEVPNSLQQQIYAINDVQLHAVDIKRMNLKQIHQETDWVDTFGKRIRPTTKMHGTYEEGALESSSQHVIAAIQEQGASEDFFWEEILGKETLPFWGLFQLSEAESALLPGLDNLGDFLKGANEMGHGNGGS